MSSRLRNDDGYVLVTAIVVMFVMLGIGLAAFNYVGAEQRSSAHERERESRLNLAEGVLASEAYLLGRNWPNRADKAFPPQCTPASTDPKCPTLAQLTANFTAVDFTKGMGWDVQIRDNGDGSSPNYYNDTTTLSQPSWDQAGGPGSTPTPDGKLWIRAEGQIAGKHRVIVALLKAETRSVVFPNAVFVAGSVGTSNSGNKVIVAEGGTTGLVRCNDNNATPDRGSNTCRAYDQSKGQIDGPVQSNANIPSSVLTPQQIELLRQMAITNGTYYASGCPLSNAGYTGAVVFVESGNCSINSNAQVNSAASPGLFVINNGTLSVTGTVDWYGPIYALNGQNAGPTDPPPVTLSGNAALYGGAFVDGNGRLQLGQSKQNLIYNGNMFPNIQSFGTVGIVQNTWRELTAG
jgi:Tfp pilus assembly protein PilX